MNDAISGECCKDFASFKRRFVKSPLLQEKFSKLILQLLGETQGEPSKDRHGWVRGDMLRWRYVFHDRAGGDGDGDENPDEVNPENNGCGYTMVRVDFEEAKRV